jgi:hypothetical protein
MFPLLLHLFFFTFLSPGSRDRGQAVHFAYTRGYAAPPA